MRRVLAAGVSIALLAAAPAVAATKLSPSSKAYKKAAAAALKATHGGKVTRVTSDPKVPGFIRYDVYITKGAKHFDVNVATDFSVSRVGPA